MRIDLDCPVEIWHCTLAEEGKVCEILLYSLTEQAVSSLEMMLVLKDAKGGELARLTHRVRSLNGTGRFTASVPMPEGMKPAGISATVEKVWYDDNRVWRRNKAPLTEFEPNTLPAGDALNQLQLAAGKDAVGWPREDDNLRIWLCVCGRPNRRETEVCARCRREKKTVFAEFTEEKVMAKAAERRELLESHEKALREEAGKRQDEREKQYRLKKKKTRRVLIIAGTCAAAGVIAYGTVAHVIPYMNYRNAVAAFEAEDYDTALPAFEKMSGYRDADGYVQKINYAIASGKLNTGDEELLTEAKTEFLALGDYEDSQKLAQECDYQTAAIMLADGRLDEASALFASLGGYADSADQVKECAYRAAKKMLEEGDAAGAQAAFESLGDYADSADQAKQAILVSAKAALEDGDPDSALSLLADMTEDASAADIIAQAHYMKGSQLSEAGEAVAAGEEYARAGDYSDAKEKASSCIYGPAVEAMEKEDWYTAAELFALIPGYEDSTARMQTCIFEQAKRAVLDTEYIRASSLLDQLPEDYEGADELRKQCVYQPALKNLEKAEYQAAIDAFTSLGDYEDSAALLKKAQYGLAEQYEKDGKTSEAIAAFTALGDYSDSADRVKKLQYGIADGYEQDGKLDEAASAFEALGDYSDSAARLKAVRLKKIQLAMDDGDWQQAIDLCAGMGDDTDAAGLRRSAQYQLAEQKLLDGDTEGAYTLFAELGDYLDAADQAKECLYAQANALKEAGSWTDAIAAYEKLAGYQDADTAKEECLISQAKELYAAGDILTAAQQLSALTDNASAQELAKAMYAELAQKSLDAKDYESAVTLFRLAGNEDKAQEALRTGIDEVWADPAAAARQAANAGDHAAVINALKELDLENAPEGYEDLNKLWQSACYAEGTAFLSAGKTADAYACLQRCRGYEDTDKLLTSTTAWKLCAVWTRGGHTYDFRPDGTCAIDGEELLWSLDGYEISTGTDAEHMTVTHKLASLDGKKLTVRDMRNGGAALMLNRTSDSALLPLPEMTSETAEAGE